MKYLKYNNENFYVTNINRIILTKYNKYYDFMKELLKINNSKNIKIEFNGLILNSKNTLIIDFSSITTAIKVLDNESRIIDEYIKSKLEKDIIFIEQEKILNDTINKILNQTYGGLKKENIEIDILKLIKSNTNLSIDNADDFLEMLNEILKNERIKKYFYFI